MFSPPWPKLNRAQIKQSTGSEPISPSPPRSKPPLPRSEPLLLHDRNPISPFSSKIGTPSLWFDSVSLRSVYSPSLVMILAGTDTSAVTMEWAMSLLVNHPEVLKKARAELDIQVGQECLVDEPDLSKLNYLQAIISETFRLFPAAPLLIPHMASNDCTIGGFDVPRDTILLVNAWAIHRNPQVWNDPTSFKPERFEGGEADGHKLMPFGMGRRSCPGAGLAQRVVGLSLASLIQCFEWKRVSEKAVDLTEGKGLTMPKLEPLEVMCKARDIMNKVL